MDGTLFALDAQTGKEKWSFKADGAIAVTPAVIGNAVYFGDFAGNIYTLDIKTGKPLFPAMNVGGPIYSSPVAVTENGLIKVYIGSNVGKLYGFNGTTGELLFPPFDTQGSAIISNPAYYQGTVFFAAENMMAYALDGTTGKLRWSNKLDGESNRGDHPIVIPKSNTVLFHTVPRFGNTGMGLKDLFFVYEVSGHGGRPKRALGDLLPDYQSQVKKYPGTKSVYLFSVSTGDEVTQFSADGKPLSMIPLNIWYANGQNFPVVLDQKDLLFAAFGGYISLDTTTGVFTIAYDSQPIRGDEYTGITVADNWLYGAFASNIGRLRLSDSKLEQLHGCRDCGDNYPPMDPFSGAHWWGYTGDGYTDMGGYMVIAEGHAYLSINGWLYGF